MSSNLPPQPPQPPSSNRNELSAKERADILLSLSKGSIERFDRLSEVSWKVRIGVWIAFGCTCGFLLTAEKWKLTWVECGIGILVTLSTVIIVVFAWGPFTYKRSTRLIRIARYWEAEAEKVIGISLPEYLLAKNYLNTGGWSENDRLEPWYKQPVYLSSALITVLFGVLVIFAFLSKLR